MIERVLTMYLYQNNVVCSKVESNISVMTKEIYHRLRQNSRMSIIENTGLSKSPTTNLKLLEKVAANKNLLNS